MVMRYRAPFEKRRSKQREPTHTLNSQGPGLTLHRGGREARERDPDGGLLPGGGTVSQPASPRLFSCYRSGKLLSYKVLKHSQIQAPLPKPTLKLCIVTTYRKGRMSGSW